ncbi:MAG: 16S rRNA (cytosine(967)-C(5))-methyltransferase RsmB [Burkholderiales bacterium]
MVELQRHAAHVVGRVLAGRSLDAQLRGRNARSTALTPQERAVLQDLTYGTLRFLGEIDALLGSLLERALESDRLRNLLRVALYQLVHTRAAPHAVVDHAVRSAVAIGEARAKGLVNAVLRAFLRNREGLLKKAVRAEVGRYSHPQWWIDKLRRQYPQHYMTILESANAHPPLTLRVNARRTTTEDYRRVLEHEGLANEQVGDWGVMLERPVPVERIPGFADGLVSVQDASAQHAAVLLDARDGMRVLDACAAPGGKTAHILERARAGVTAVDSDASRLERVRSNLNRLGLSAHLVCGDAAAPQTWWDGRPYERILADVPCSASGVVRRHPDIKWLRRPEDIARFAQRQRDIVEALWQLLGTDGKLLYATCSVFHEENGEQIERFLERHDNARQLTLPGRNTNPQLPAGQILPDTRHDGFFYALLQKTSAAQ